MIYILQKYLNNFVTVYFDNIIIYLRNLEEHNQYVQLIIKELIKAGLTLKIKKYKFDITQVNYLEITYTTNRLKILEEKINDILK